MRSKNLRTTSQVREHYEQNGDTYDVVRYGTPGGRYVDEREQAFVTSVIKGSRVLEVGTASGRFAVSLTRRRVEYIGVDLSQKMLRTTLERTNHSASVLQMNASNLGFRKYFEYTLCIRTFHFLPNPIVALEEMFSALSPSGKCLVSFEVDNLFRRFLLFLGIGTSEQYYYTISDAEEMFVKAGFKILRSGAVMRIPVTFYRKCPRVFLPILKRLEGLWPWPMHDYVLGSK